MANSAWVWLLLVSVFLLVQSVAEDFQHHWLVPDGSKDDFSETFYNGNSLRVQWAGWDPWFIKNNLNGATEADLWVVAWNADVSSFHRYLSGKHGNRGLLDNILMVSCDSGEPHLEKR